MIGDVERQQAQREAALRDLDRARAFEIIGAGDSLDDDCELANPFRYGAER